MNTTAERVKSQHTQGLLMAERIPATFNPKMDGFQIIGITPDGSDMMTIALCTVNEADEANARRLVACWNACQRFETDLLERVSRPGCHGIHPAPQERIDDLLTALERVMALNCPLTGNPSHQTLVEFWEEEKLNGRGGADERLFALSVIAKVKGGAV